MAFGYFILLLGGLIFFHEFGHFIVARLCGVRVLVFSLGFGPRFTVYRSPKTGTEYCVSLLPLGGYVKMLGDDPDEPLPEADRRESFSAQPLWKRSAIVAAGPVFNLVLPIFLFFFLAFGEAVHPPQVGLVMPGGPAAEAGLRPGDRIVSIDGDPVDYWWQLQSRIGAASGRALSVNVDRGGESVELAITPRTYSETRYAEIGAVDVRPQIRVVQFYLAPIIWAHPASAAHEAGLRPWDRVVAVGEEPVKAWYEVEQKLRARRGTAVSLHVVRLADEPEVAAGVRLLPPAKTAKIDLRVPDAPEPADALGLLPSELVVREVDTDSPAAAMGLVPGDRIVGVDGETVATWGMLTRRIQQGRGDSLQIEWVRGNETLSGTLEPTIKEERGELNNEVRRVVFGARNFSEYGAPDAIENAHVWSYAFRQAFVETWDKTRLTVLAVAGLFSGKVPMKDLGGPILIGQLAAKTEQYGWRYFFQIMVMLSINLGLLNLLPIPVLDGGHLFMFAIEGLRRKPLSQRWRQGLMYAGLAFIVVLMVVVFKNDIERSWGDIVGAFR